MVLILFSFDYGRSVYGTLRVSMSPSILFKSLARPTNIRPGAM